MAIISVPLWVGYDQGSAHRADHSLQVFGSKCIDVCRRRQVIKGMGKRPPVLQGKFPDGVEDHLIALHARDLGRQPNIFR